MKINVNSVMDKSFSLSNTGLPAGLNIWAIGSDSKDDRHLVKVGASYESAMSVIIDSKNPLPVQVLDSPGTRLECALDAHNLKPSDWIAVRKFIMEHDWLLKEACIGYMDPWSVDKALLIEEYFGEAFSYGWSHVGNIDNVELFEAELTRILMECEISSDAEMSYFTEMDPTKASNYLLPQWKENILPEGDENSGMIHIIQNYTKIGQIRDLLNFDHMRKRKEIVIESLNITESSYKTLKTSILRKIKKSPEISFNPNDFDRKEVELIQCIIKLSNKSLFPEKMSKGQIRSAIRTAYENAQKAGSIQIPPGFVDRINRYGNNDLRLQQLYQGTAAGMIIHIWFVIKDQEISTAYPITISK